MRKYFIVIFLMLLTTSCWWSYELPLAESASPAPQIVIAQLKITSSNGQFITLYNNTASTIDLSTVQLQYFNNYDLLKATSGKLISLSGKVPAHGYVVINDGPIQVCYQMVVDSVSLGLSSTAGMIQLSHFSSNSSPQFISVLDDYVAWSKAPSSSASPLPSGVVALPSATTDFLQRQPHDTNNAPSISSVGSGSWINQNQPDGSTLCTVSAGTIGSGGQLLSANASPPSTYKSASAGYNLPTADVGLMVPQLSEILPNPAPPLADSTDEYVELYNPNDVAFDLSGFSLQAGTSTIHNYIFPSGQFILQPHEFRAFYAPQTDLSLSNDSGQIKFLDPSGETLSSSDVYQSAKDGYAWVYASGKWQWTTTPTPNASNLVTEPPAATAKAASKSTATKTSKVAAAKNSKAASKTSALAASTNNGILPKVAGINPMIIAGVGSLALIYAVYEYRHDLANIIYRFRRNRALGQDIG